MGGAFGGDVRSVGSPIVVRVCLWLATLGCAGPGPDTPSAVIELLPETICEGDAHATEVLLDGRASSSHLALVPVPPEPGDSPLRFAWSLSGAEHRVVSGALDADRLVITSAGDRPLHVELAVTNGAGGVARHLRTLSITRPLVTACAGAGECAVDETCASDLGVCIAAHDCRSDADCETCTSCDVARARCVPRAR